MPPDSGGKRFPGRMHEFYMRGFWIRPWKLGIGRLRLWEATREAIWMRTWKLKIFCWEVKGAYAGGHWDTDLGADTLAAWEGVRRLQGTLFLGWVRISVLPFLAFEAFSTTPQTMLLGGTENGRTADQ